MNTFDFKNRTAVITGGGQGFGLDIAKRFLESGAKVIIWDIDEELLKSATNEVNNPNLSYNVIDVSNYSQIENTVIEITSKNKIDILINNAGITGPTAPLWEYDVEMWNKIVQINLVGTFNCCRAIVPGYD
jgi:3-oxoacyl-[acyl-carrier protein] reductase